MSNIKNYKGHWEKVDDITGGGGGQGTTIKALNIQDKQTISAVKICPSGVTPFTNPA